MAAPRRRWGDRRVAIVPQVLNQQRAAMSLGCCGARAYLDVLTDDVALWALPAHRLDQYCGQIVTFANAEQDAHGVSSAAAAGCRVGPATDDSTVARAAVVNRTVSLRPHCLGVTVSGVKPVLGWTTRDRAATPSWIAPSHLR